MKDEITLVKIKNAILVGTEVGEEEELMAFKNVDELAVHLKTIFEPSELQKALADDPYEVKVSQIEPLEEVSEPVDEPVEHGWKCLRDNGRCGGENEQGDGTCCRCRKKKLPKFSRGLEKGEK